MYDIINKIIETYTKRGKRLEVIRRYIRMKYRINIDMQSMKRRLIDLKPDINAGSQEVKRFVL
jgi:hypothetical protein